MNLNRHQTKPCRCCHGLFSTKSNRVVFCSLQCRFLSEGLMVGPQGKCWEWRGNRDVDGYGRFRWNYEMFGAHRVAWELAHGPVPAGMLVLHRCDNPPCCNPDHLWLGTNVENIADRHAKGRTRHNPNAGNNGRCAERTKDGKFAAKGMCGV